ncbi:MAG: zinc-binding dehydrogenase [Candidatus Methylomirabilis sp.]|nr:zinc-binding dehydrogenase [Candidatus Methylomirabilis sp.]
MAVLRHRYGSSIRLVSVDHHEDRLALAKSLGADAALNTAGGSEKEGVQAALGSGGADVVIEAVGSTQAHQEAFELVGRGGTLIPFGGVAKDAVLPLDLHRLHYEEIRIVPIYHHTPADFADAVQAIARREVPVGRLITARLPSGSCREHSRWSRSGRRCGRSCCRRVNGADKAGESRFRQRRG